LSDFIRHEIGLTGTHVGCESGVCGACTVLLDGLATRSCCTLAVQADGRSVETVESLGRVNNLSPLQRGFWEQHGLQCGYCTPGMLMLMTELLREKSQSRPRDHTAAPERQYLPLHRIRGHRQFGRARGRIDARRKGGALMAEAGKILSPPAGRQQERP